MSRDKDKVFKMWTSESISLNIYNHLRWHEMTFLASRKFEEYSKILSISYAIMWNTQKDIIFTTRMDIPNASSKWDKSISRETSSSSYQWFVNIILPMDQYYPIDGSSLSLSYQWINIILSMYHQNYPTNGSTLPYRRNYIIIILWRNGLVDSCTCISLYYEPFYLTICQLIP